MRLLPPAKGRRDAYPTRAIFSGEMGILPVRLPHKSHFFWRDRHLARPSYYKSGPWMKKCDRTEPKQAHRTDTLLCRQG